MQEIPFFIKSDRVAGDIVDEFGQSIDALPTVVRGTQAMLCVRLMTSDNVAYPMDKLASIVSWEFVVAHDWLSETVPQIRVTEGIELVGDGVKTEIRIPLLNLNTVELISQLGNSPSITLGTELIGFEVANTIPQFCLQSSLTILNRRSDAGTGSPTPTADGNYSSAQVDALLIAGYARQFVAAAGDTPTEAETATAHADQQPDDTHYRDRLAAYADGRYAAWTRMIVGPAGPIGNGVEWRAWGSLAARPETPTAEQTPYLDENTGLVYVYVNGSWSPGVNVRGPVGPKIESFPPFSPVIAGWEYWLDAAFNRLDLLYRVRGMKKIRLTLASANPAITGNIAVAFMINDIESAVVAILVGATETEFEHAFTPPVSGKFAIVRRIENPLDTLRDGVPVTAVLTNIELEY